MSKENTPKSEKKKSGGLGRDIIGMFVVGVVTIP
jgi:hypothetical protein